MKIHAYWRTLVCAVVVVLSPLAVYADPFVGGFGDDVLIGTERDDHIRALSGNDEITGRGGDDFTFGDSGNDKTYWFAGDGSDVADGGEGTDTLFVSLAGASGGSVTINPSGDVVTDYGGDMLRATSMEILDFTGSENNDTLAIRRGAFTEIRVHGGDGDDVIGSGVFSDNFPFTINGDGGNDEITGGNLTDRLSGGDGDDVIRDGRGSDFVYGNAGNDKFYWVVDEQDGDVTDPMDSIDGGAGSDWLHMNLLSAFPTIFVADEIVFSQAGDTVTMEINDFDTVFATNVETIEIVGNVLQMEASAVTVNLVTRGAAETTAVDGVIIGGAGDDVLAGGGTLTGNGGTDVFVPVGFNTVTDLQTGEYVDVSLQYEDLDITVGENLFELGLLRLHVEEEFASLSRVYPTDDPDLFPVSVQIATLEGFSGAFRVSAENPFLLQAIPLPPAVGLLLSAICMMAGAVGISDSKPQSSALTRHGN